MKKRNSEDLARAYELIAKGFDLIASTKNEWISKLDTMPMQLRDSEKGKQLLHDAEVINNLLIKIEDANKRLYQFCLIKELFIPAP